MEELPGIIIAIVVIFFIARYFSGSKQKSEPIAIGTDGVPTNGPLRGVSAAMIQNVHAAFPHISHSAIAYSLSKTRSVQATSEAILEQGFLPEPPASFPTHPYITSLAPPPPQPSTPTTATADKPQINHPSLIERYNLTSAVRAQDKGKARQADGELSEAAQSRAWNADKAAREKTLQDRKAKMILEARQRLLEKQAAQKLKQNK
ncbi:hypothetical protein NCC49_004921 [Naganishia albida]|nr:hypothetical protein NCC49_004921 [Naganishia albida]